MPIDQTKLVVKNLNGFYAIF